MSEPAPIRIDYVPRDWQRLCHTKKRRFTVLALHRRAGKSEFALMELLDRAMKCQHATSQFFYVAPYLKQAKTIAWVRLKQKIKPLIPYGAATINESELSVRLTANNATIRIYGADNPDAMRGVRLDGVVIDEVAQIKPSVWEDIIQPALSDRKGWALFIGTPSGVNVFSDLYFRARHYDDWHAQSFTVFDTNAIDQDEITRLQRDMSETSFAREYLCDFSAAGDDQLISLSDVQAASERVIGDNDIFFAPLIIGVDPARYGDDRSVIIIRKGLKCFDPIILRGIDNMALAAKVAGQMNKHRPDSVFIDSGAGSGVIDRLRQIGRDVIEIPFSSKPSNAKFLNKRAEMWFAMRDWLEQGGCIPDNQELKQDLSAPVYFYNAAGRIQLESKDEIKKRGLPSTDVADALALTFAYPVAPKYSDNHLTPHKPRPLSIRGHDPYAVFKH